jgi:capsular polysaccharide biosynthesis protein
VLDTQPMAAMTSVALVAAALAAMVVAALRIHGIARVFLFAQVAYWSFSYVARPLVLLWVQPQPQFADDIADPRLASIGYDHGIAAVLQPVVFGLWVYAAVVVSYAIWSRGRDRTTEVGRTDNDLVATLATTYALGLVGRVVSYVDGSAGVAGEVESSNAILSFAAGLATVGALGLIIFFRPEDRRTATVTIGGLVLMELLWTVAVESKTPIMGAALAVAIRFARFGWTRRRVAGIAATAVVGISGFGWLQSFKQSAASASASALTDARYPPLVRPFLTILRRFDLLEAATDAYYMGGRPWLSFDEVLRYLLESLVPAQLIGSEKFHSGTAWASQVRGASVDMAGVSVSLADGNINEGYVLGGYAGVVVGVLFTFGLLLFAVRTFRAQHIALIAIGLELAESPVLFERGILGSMELVGKSLQLAVLVWLIDLAVVECRRRAARRSEAAPDVHSTRYLSAIEEGTEHMGLSELYRSLRRRWLIVVMMVLVGAGTAAGYASIVPTTYTASTRLYVAMATGTSVNDSYQGGLAAQQRIASYSYVANGNAVAQRVIDNLGLDTSTEELQSRIAVSFPPATTLLEISVIDSTPDRARRLADGVASQVRAVVNEMETTVADAAPAARLNVLDPAQTPTSRTSPNLTRILAVGLLAGFALGCLAALIRDRLDSRVRRPDQLDRILPAPVLASIPRREPDAATAQLCSRLLTLPSAPSEESAGTALLLSSLSGHSVPTMAIGLATALADTGRGVVVVDADRSRDGISARLDMLSEPGVADWLRSPRQLLELVHVIEDGFGVLPRGVIDKRTAGLLGSARVGDLLNDLKNRFDYVRCRTRRPPSPSRHAARAHWASSRSARHPCRRCVRPPDGSATGWSGRSQSTRPCAGSGGAAGRRPRARPPRR